MDPKANLDEQLSLAQTIVTRADEFEDEAVQLAELVLALDHWRGFDPYAEEGA